MKPIFNRHGRTIGWLNNGVIYDRKNCIRAFIVDNHIFTYDSRHLGVVNNGIFRDTQGQRIAFMDEASSDPMLPIPENSPTPPIPKIPTDIPTPPKPSNVPLTSSHWNPLKWEEFLDG